MVLASLSVVVASLLVTVGGLLAMVGGSLATVTAMDLAMVTAMESELNQLQ